MTTTTTTIANTWRSCVHVSRLSEIYAKTYEDAEAPSKSFMQTHTTSNDTQIDVCLLRGSSIEHHNALITFHFHITHSHQRHMFAIRMVYMVENFHSSRITMAKCFMASNNDGAPNRWLGHGDVNICMMINAANAVKSSSRTAHQDDQCSAVSRKHQWDAFHLTFG